MTSGVDYLKGWFFDRGDPSVGIFGEEWIHDDCGVVQGPGNGDLLGVSHSQKQLGKVHTDGTVTMINHLTCKDCGEERVFETVEFVGLDDEPDIE